MFPELQTVSRFALAIVTALVISFGITPIVKSFAQHVGAMDIPDHKRHLHAHPTPRMGGMAIFLGFLVSVVLFADLTKQLQGVLIGAVLIVALGIVDDIMNLRWWIKLLVQIAAAVVAVAHGVRIEVLMNPNVFSQNQHLFVGILSVPITVLWIVGVTNAVNLIDGLDGLACGVSAISSLTMMAVALMVSEMNVALVLACLMGACVGFIPYNMNPAKIFMGDTGALLLGYILATMSIMGLFKFYAVVSFIVPLLALALPIFDTIFAIIRRVIHGQNPMKPDRGHLHHKLIDMGLGQKQTVAVLYGLSAMMGLTAVVISSTGQLRMLLLCVELVIAFAVGGFIYRTLEAGHPHKHETEDETAQTGTDPAPAPTGTGPDAPAEAPGEESRGD